MHRFLSKLLVAGVSALVSANVIAGCVVCGCANELCVKEGENPFSICIWKAEFQCYSHYGICEENAQGICGWRQSNDLVSCIKQMQEKVANTDTYTD